jgi:hypothetical protein
MAMSVGGISLEGMQSRHDILKHDERFWLRVEIACCKHYPGTNERSIESAIKR